MAQQDVVGPAGLDHARHHRARVAQHAPRSPAGSPTGPGPRESWPAGTTSPTGRTHPVDTRCAGMDRPARTTAAARGPGPSRDRQRTLPADALGDHRRRHARELLNNWLDIAARPRRPPTDAAYGRTPAAPPTATPPAPCCGPSPLRTISLIDRPSARCSRRISAQSSTLSTPFLPGRKSEGSLIHTVSGGPEGRGSEVDR